jgi:hypothetical protein
MSKLSKMKEGHLNIGDVVRLGWPAALGNGLWRVVSVRSDSINDIEVSPYERAGDSWITRSLGATVVTRG